MLRNRVISAVLKRRSLVLALALLLCVASLFTMGLTRTNYDMASYLPPNAPSTRALKLIEAGLPNMQLYLPKVGVREALEAKRELMAIPYVEGVLWLDDSLDLRAQPFETLPEKQVNAFYAKGGALFHLTIDLAHSADAYQGIMERFPDALAKGDAANQALIQTVSMGEIASIMYYVLPLVLIILLISTRHWLEPLLFLMAIGMAILANQGTNLIFGQVSFVTQACSAVLQLAVSIDYAVFLLHRFGEYRAQGLEAREAMEKAMRKSASAIAASALTTVFGFLALLAMDFGMGRDMGLVLAKGVVLSYLSVMVVLPAAAVSLSKWIDKTAHRSFMPRFERTGRVIVRFSAPLAILMALLLLPAFLGQSRNSFVYGSDGMHGAGSKAAVQSRQIDSIFDRSQPMMLMVPEGQPASLAALSDEVKALPFVRGVISYPETVGLPIPAEVLPEAQLKQLRNGGFDRLILYADLPAEGEEAFSAVKRLRETAEKHYPGNSHLLGESAVNYDLKETITGDSPRVLLLGMIAIGLTLMVTFKNPTIPVILLLVIEGSIWINMAVPYFAGAPMNYIGYQIVSSVQLGATVDYGILLAQRYVDSRRSMGKKEAAAKAVTRSAGSILPPMMILVIAGYALSLVVKSNAIISQMGEVIGRGAGISGLMVLLVLPKVLQWCDGLIRRTYFRKKEAYEP